MNIKKGFVVMLIIGMGIMISVRNVQAQEPVSEAIKEGVKKVIKAVDLKIQRLQNKTIWLQNTQKVIENTMSKLKLDEITSWVEKQRNLYKDYYEELWRVKALITYYGRVKDIIQKQKALVEEYKRAWAMIKQNKHFSPEELRYMENVYSGILGESLKNVDRLSLVINAFTTQMDDAGRMKIIQSVANAVDENYQDLTRFNTQNIMLGTERERDLNDTKTIQNLYGLDNQK